MTPERFHALLQTCGADLRRWPEAERDAARELLANGATELSAARADAAMLDRDLDAHRLAAADAALIERIVGTAPAAASDEASIEPGAGVVPSAARSGGPVRSWWRRGAGLFWPRAGWALAGLAGAIAGAMAVSVALGDAGPAAATDWQGRTTAFTDRGADWSEE
jgi:hypothetical protein